MRSRQTKTVVHLHNMRISWTEGVTACNLKDKHRPWLKNITSSLRHSYNRATDRPFWGGQSRPGQPLCSALLTSPPWEQRTEMPCRQHTNLNHTKTMASICTTCMHNTVSLAEQLLAAASSCKQLLAIWRPCTDKIHPSNSITGFPFPNTQLLLDCHDQHIFNIAQLSQNNTDRRQALTNATE